MESGWSSGESIEATTEVQGLSAALLYLSRRTFCRLHSIFFVIGSDLSSGLDVMITISSQDDDRLGQ